MNKLKICGWIVVVYLALSIIAAITKMVVYSYKNSIDAANFNACATFNSEAADYDDEPPTVRPGD